MRLIPDEVAQITMLHVGQHHQRRALSGQADAQQRQHVGMAEIFHDDALLQKLGHFLNIRNTLNSKSIMLFIICV